MIYGIREYHKGMFTVSVSCKNSTGGTVKSHVSDLHKNDLDRLCILDNQIYGKHDCIKKLDPKEKQEFSQQYTDLVKNNASASRSCDDIKVYKANNLGDAYNVYATCDYYVNEINRCHTCKKTRENSLYFIRKKDLSSMCNLNGDLHYGKKCE